jgi:hypothetical protein
MSLRNYKGTHQASRLPLLLMNSNKMIYPHEDEFEARGIALSRSRGPPTHVTARNGVLLRSRPIRRRGVPVAHAKFRFYGGLASLAVPHIRSDPCERNRLYGV